MVAQQISFRVTAPDEWRTAADMFRAALLSAPASDDDWEKPGLRDSWAESHSISAWEGERCVGHASAFHFTTAVPGGATVLSAGVTRVGVLQTHTRRGVLTGALTRLLSDSIDQGKVLATLRATEAVIYGRFGFAVAGETCEVEIRRHGAQVVAPVADGTIRILDRDEILATVMEVHGRVGLDRPGAILRPEWMQRRYLEGPLAPDKAAWVIVHTGADGIDDGWAQYSTEWPETFGDHSGGVCQVDDVWGATPQVELALWKFILDLDLIGTFRTDERAVDDAVRFALADVRSYHAKIRSDEQWLRLLRVNDALTARSYNPASGAVTIAVTDSMFPANTGTWRVSAAGAERVASSATDDADLATTINGLSATYMGGTSWHDALVSGHVEQRTPGALAMADVLFASRPLPRCGSFF